MELSESNESGVVVAAKTTLTQRAADYFGRNNAARMTIVRLGRHRLAFVSTSRMWVYEEVGPNHRPDGIGVNLTPRMRADLMRALDGGSPDA